MHADFQHLLGTNARGSCIAVSPPSAEETASERCGTSSGGERWKKKLTVPPRGVEFRVGGKSRYNRTPKKEAGPSGGRLSGPVIT